MTFVPSPQQATIFTHCSTLNPANVLIQAVAGSGKCLGKDTPILMFDGSIKPVQNVAQGDLIMGPDSKPRTVLNTTTGQEELFKIKPVKGDEWVCNRSHILSLTGTNRFKGKVKNISINDFLSETQGEFDRTGRRDKQWKQYRSPVDFPKVANELPPRFVGIFLGDGARNSACLTLSNTQLLEYTDSVALRLDLNINHNTDGNKCTRASYGNSNNLGKPKSNLILNLGREVKAGKFIPKRYLINDRKSRLELLAGILDTDGYQSGHSCEITVKEKEFSDNILFLCRSLGFAAYRSDKFAQLEGWDEPRLYHRINISGDLLEIPFMRLKPNPREQTKRVSVTGFEVESLGVGYYYGFEITGDRLFLLGDFTVTHNTTTIVNLVSVLRQQHSLGRAVLLAFNKDIADELKAKGLPASTFHSLGMRTVFDYCRFYGLQKPQIKADKCSLIFNYMSGITPDEKRVFRSNVLKLVSLAKNASIHPVSDIHAAGRVYQLIAQHDIYSEHPLWDSAKATGLVMRVLAQSLDHTGMMDYDDMLYMPVQLEMQFPTYKWVFVDEAQDTNLLQRQFLKRLNGQHHVFVGDRSQAIYGFRGADSTVMDLICQEFQCVELPLSVTYRCPQIVVDMAQQYCPSIQARENAPQGTFTDIGTDYLLSQFTSQDAILCRNARPLIALALRFYKNQIPAHVLGRDVGKGLLDLIDRMQARTLPHLIEKLDEYFVAVAKKVTEDEGNMLQALEDKIDCIKVVAHSVNELQGEPTLAGMRSLMQELFKQNTGVTLSTIHKCKGMEWPNVFLLDEHLLPSSYAKQDWQLLQEDNLRYVCYTRATSALHFMTGEV